MIRRPGRAAGVRRTIATLAGLVVAVAAGADWLQPDISYREAQLVLKLAMRDTTGRADDPGRLDSLGTILLRLDRQDDAERVFRRSLEIQGAGPTARAGLAKIALFHGRTSEVESLLAGVADPGESARRDLFAARLRDGRYADAASLASEIGEDGRVPLLERLAAEPPYRITGGSGPVRVPWVRAYPVPLVRVKLNGQGVVMAIDTGASDLLIDDGAARRLRVENVPGQRLEFWSGSRLAVKNGIVQKLEIGGVRIERLPAGILPLRRWSLEVHPRSEPVAGIIGLELLRRFTPTLDYPRHELALGPAEVPYAARPGALRVPFETWGVNELMVHGSLAGSRRMAFVVQTGVPGCGVGAPVEVFDEIGVRPGAMSRLVRGAGQFLQGRPWAGCVVPAVSVGPVVRDKVPGWLGALDAGELWRHGVRREALLSNDFFKNHRLTIDWPRRELVFEE